jgi:hypothetical protein
MFKNRNEASAAAAALKNDILDILPNAKISIMNVNGFTFEKSSSVLLEIRVDGSDIDEMENGKDAQIDKLISKYDRDAYLKPYTQSFYEIYLDYEKVRF